MSLITNLSTKEKVDLLKELYHDIAGKGQDGDTMLAHINPEEALLLKAHGGSGTINPYTGLPEYKKAVKKIAKVAAVAAAVYYGGAALSSAMGTTSAAKFGSTAFWKGTSTSLFSKAGAAFATAAKAFSPSALQVAGLGLQTAGYLQQRKYAAAQADATVQQIDEQKRINQMQERIRLVQERRQRLDILRQQRFQQGDMEGKVAQSGLGLVGTSAFTGATSAIQTQATANLGALNMASGGSTAISQASQRAADFGSQANRASAMSTQWTQVSSLGGKLYDKGPEIFDLGKSIFG